MGIALYPVFSGKKPKQDEKYEVLGKKPMTTRSKYILFVVILLVVSFKLGQGYGKWQEKQRPRGDVLQFRSR